MDSAVLIETASVANRPEVVYYIQVRLERECYPSKYYYLAYRTGLLQSEKRRFISIDIPLGEGIMRTKIISHESSAINGECRNYCQPQVIPNVSPETLEQLVEQSLGLTIIEEETYKTPTRP